MKAASKAVVFDTTLRDGEQAAGTHLGSRDKATLARQLAWLRADIIGAGFPPSLPKDFDAVQVIAIEIKEPKICVLTRALVTDIESRGKAFAKHRFPDIHLTGKFRDGRYPNNHHLDIEFPTGKLLA